MTAGDTTTIKVPKTLRDRIATRAQREHSTLAAVIDDALNAADERTFWKAVQRENASLPVGQREADIQSSSSVESLVDADDDLLSAQGRW
ncbi:hypothetical protein IV498_12035 [Paenarthrobacter sp. Z7-10]|nr:hypothetical protein [Paenarthrobacter sp. Z7-10]